MVSPLYHIHVHIHILPVKAQRSTLLKKHLLQIGKMRDRIVEVKELRNSEGKKCVMHSRFSKLA